MLEHQGKSLSKLVHGGVLISDRDSRVSHLSDGYLRYFVSFSGTLTCGKLRD